MRAGVTRLLVAVVVAATTASATLLHAPGAGAAAPAATSETERIVPVIADPTPELPVTVESADDRTVTVTDVSRVVSLNGSLSEVLFALGLGDRLVGRDVTTTFDEAKRVPVVTRAHDVSAESVLSRRPTLVLAQVGNGPPAAFEQLRASGVPVLVFEEPESIEGIGAREMAVATALGVPDAGVALRARTRAELRTVQQRIPKGVDKPKVAFLYMRGQAGVYLIGGKGSGADSMIEAAGGIDAGSKMGLTKSFTPITSEALVAAAPDIILMTTTGLASVGGIDGLVEIPGIAQTPAGINRRIVTQEDGLLFSFGSRTPEAVAALIRGFHRSSRSQA